MKKLRCNEKAAHKKYRDNIILILLRRVSLLLSPCARQQPDNIQLDAGSLSHRVVAFRGKIKETSSITEQVSVVMGLSFRDQYISNLFQRPPSLRAHLRGAKNLCVN